MGALEGRRGRALHSLPEVLRLAFAASECKADPNDFVVSSISIFGEQAGRVGFVALCYE